MPRYTPQTWYNDSLDTPVSKARMDVMENGILDAHVVPSGKINAFIGVPSAANNTVIDVGITTGWTALSFNEDYDPLGWHPGASMNPGCVRIGIPGVYLVYAQAIWPSTSAAGSRYTAIVLTPNGGTAMGGIAATRERACETNPSGQPQAVSTLLKCGEGDRLHIQIYQTSGGSLALQRLDLSWTLLSYG